tara:strand:- start:45 stop:248 length:204 start_codon:yes stop_codon:yes gene_type:complete
MMALSKQVEESLRDAESNLRNALAYAARNEKPYVSKHITDMIMTIDSVINIDTMFDRLEERLGDSPQ